MNMMIVAAGAVGAMVADAVMAVVGVTATAVAVLNGAMTVVALRSGARDAPMATARSVGVPVDHARYAGLFETDGEMSDGFAPGGNQTLMEL